MYKNIETVLPSALSTQKGPSVRYKSDFPAKKVPSCKGVWGGCDGKLLGRFATAEDQRRIKESNRLVGPLGHRNSRLLGNHFRYASKKNIAPRIRKNHGLFLDEHRLSFRGIVFRVAQLVDELFNKARGVFFAVQ